jgi:hypothetical protein
VEDAVGVELRALRWAIIRADNQRSQDIRREYAYTVQGETWADGSVGEGLAISRPMARPSSLATKKFFDSTS